MKYSIIIPVYNRPDEVNELLQSLAHQTLKDFEVIVVEDGSNLKSETIVNSYQGKLNIQYQSKENSGPGLSRNFGAQYAKSEWLIFLDSDVVLPEKYLEEVEKGLSMNNFDAFGGPDNAHKSFSLTQKAVNYSMTSFLVSGGIRGKSDSFDKFYPRSFNMGIKREVFDKVTGFSDMRYGEDIDLSLRIVGSDFKTTLLKSAYVFHRRRTNLIKFFWQVFHSGSARIILSKKHPGSLKLVHWLPFTAIVSGVVLVTLGITTSFLFFVPIIVYLMLVFLSAAIENKSVLVGAVSIFTSIIQILGYGLGFLIGFFKY